VDAVLVNNQKPTEEQVEHYKLQEGENVMVENDMLTDSRLVLDDILNSVIISADKNDKIAHLRAFIRHSSEKLKEVVENKILKHESHI
jgi:hypothetical protein